MASYILRKIDPELWQAVKARAADQGLNVKALVEQLLREWLKRDHAVGHVFVASYGNRDYCGTCGEHRKMHAG